MPFRIHCPDVQLEETHVLPTRAEEHEWFYFDAMTHDECLVFVSGDTDGSWPAVPHTSFADAERALEDDPPRRSIEARVFVLFE